MANDHDPIPKTWIEAKALFDLHRSNPISDIPWYAVVFIPPEFKTNHDIVYRELVKGLDELTQNKDDTQRIFRSILQDPTLIGPLDVLAVPKTLNPELAFFLEAIKDPNAKKPPPYEHRSYNQKVAEQMLKRRKRDSALQYIYDEEPIIKQDAIRKLLRHDVVLVDVALFEQSYLGDAQKRKDFMLHSFGVMMPLSVVLAHELDHAERANGMIREYPPHTVSNIYKLTACLEDAAMKTEAKQVAFLKARYPDHYGDLEPRSRYVNLENTVDAITEFARKLVPEQQQLLKDDLQLFGTKHPLLSDVVTGSVVNGGCGEDAARHTAILLKNAIARIEHRLAVKITDHTHFTHILDTPAIPDIAAVRGHQAGPAIRPTHSHLGAAVSDTTPPLELIPGSQGGPAATPASKPNPEKAASLK